MQNNAFQLLFKDKIYKIPIMFKHIVDLPLKISETLIFSSLHQYQVESKVSDEVFQQYIDYMINDKLPEIDINNIHDFFQLSQEFHLLEDQVKSKTIELGEYLVNLNGLLNKNSQDVSHYEETISANLDDYLVKYGKNLMKSPIQSLFNIFNHKSRKLTKHDLAYELIEDYFNETNDSNVFVLLDSIDGTKLSKSNLEHSILLRKSRFNHMPDIQFDFLASAAKSLEKLNDQIEKMKAEMSEMKKKHENDINGLIQKNESEKSEMIKNNQREVDELNKKIEEKMKKLIIKSEKDKSELMELFKGKINSIQLKYNQEIERMKQDNVQLTRKINENEEFIKKKEEEERKKKEEEERKKREIDCNFKSDQLDGIISYLKKNYGDDLEKSGVLKLTDPGIMCSYPVAHLFMYDKNNINEEYDNQYSGHANQSDGWFEIDFKDKKINLTSYTLRTSGRGPNRYSHPKSWRIVGSNDRNKWDVLNHQTNNSSLNGEHYQNRFTCENNPNYYRYIKFIQEDSWCSFTYNIGLTCIELFGYIQS